MGGTCSMHVEIEKNAYKILEGKSKEERPIERDL